MARPSRLCVTRSHASDLLNNRADDDEIRAAIDDETRAALPLALDGALNEQAPAPAETLAQAIGPFVALVGQNWTRAGREEFIGIAAFRLSKLPGRMALDALDRACDRLTDGRLLVAWVLDDVEPKAAKLQAEIDRLGKLAELALG